MFDILLLLAASKESHIKEVVCVNIARRSPASLYFELATTLSLYL
jgi:hypothetical protein